MPDGWRVRAVRVTLGIGMRGAGKNGCDIDVELVEEPGVEASPDGVGAVSFNGLLGS